MTIQQAMTAADLLKPSALPLQARLDALNELESTVFEELICTHEGSAATFFGYTPDSDFDTRLLLPAPYDQVYVYWLLCRIDLANNEIDRYQNSAGLFNQAWEACVRWYNRTHPPKGPAGFTAKGAAV